MYNFVSQKNGEVLFSSPEVKAEIQEKVKTKYNPRYGHGYEFDEFNFFCPNCNKHLAYHNGVTLMFGSLSNKYCSECGYKLIYPSSQDLDNAKQLYYMMKKNKYK